MPMIARMFRRVPLAMSRPAWTGTTTVRPSGWRITRWLPLILATAKPARSSPDHLRPRNGREGAGHQATSRVSVSSSGGPTSASKASSAFRRSPTAASAVGPSPTAPTPGRSCAEAHQTPFHPVLRRKARGLRGSQRRFSHTSSAARISAGSVLGQPHNRRRTASGLVRAPVQPDQLGEQDMPPPFSTTRRRATTDSGHTRRPESHVRPATSRRAALSVQR